MKNETKNKCEKRALNKVKEKGDFLNFLNEKCVRYIWRFLVVAYSCCDLSWSRSQLLDAPASWFLHHDSQIILHTFNLSPMTTINVLLIFMCYIIESKGHS